MIGETHRSIALTMKGFLPFVREDSPERAAQAVKKYRMAREYSDWNANLYTVDQELVIPKDLETEQLSETEDDRTAPVLVMTYGLGGGRWTATAVLYDPKEDALKEHTLKDPPLVLGRINFYAHSVGTATTITNLWLSHSTTVKIRDENIPGKPVDPSIQDRYARSVFHLAGVHPS